MITPYLVFKGECRDALGFYRSVFNCGEPKVLPYGDYMPEGSKTPPELLRTWVMHAEMIICGTNVWFADEAVDFSKGESIRLSVTVPTGKEAAHIFEALCAGGQVTLPPTETFYSVFHAAVTDRFGINWNVVAEEPPKTEKEAETTKKNQRIYKMTISKVYPMLVQKAEKKGRSKEEVDEVIFWLTGYDRQGLQTQIEKEVSLKTFFDEAPQINPNAEKIKGVVCGVRVEEIDDPIVQKIRRLDKLVDELAKGKAMEKILRV